MERTSLSGYKAVILAGGKGTRLFPITKAIPKPLLPVNSKPMINYLMDLLFSFGIRESAVLINRDFKEDFYWWRRRYYPRRKIKFFEEKKPLGTFGGLWFLKKWISNKPFFFANGDDLTKVNLARMADFHERHKAIATLALVKVSDPRSYGAVICEKGIIQEFQEKPKNPSSKYINSGLYLLNPEIFKYHPGPKFLMIEKDIFPKLAEEKKLAGFKFNGKWIDCGTWDRYEEAIKKWH